MSEPAPDSSDCAHWWDQYVELADGQDIVLGQLDEFIRLTDRLVRAAEDHGLDSSPLIRFHQDLKSHALGFADVFPTAGQNVHVLLDRMTLRFDKLASPSTTPSPEPVPAATEPPVEKLVLNRRGEQPVVLGKPHPPLTETQFNVITALVEAGDDGLSQVELLKRSGHSDARNVLKRLAKSSPEWAMVIQFPGHRGVGYRIRR
ncbi:MAG: hypothetical protein U0871_28205 [Gemmataceae bacterium]